MSPEVPPATAVAPTAGPASGGQQLRRIAITFLVGLLLLVWLSVGVFVTVKRQDALAAERRQNSNLARALQEQTVRVLASADQATVRLRDIVAGGKTPPDLVRLANETGLVPGILVQLTLIDAQGRMVGSNLDPDGSKSGHVDLSTREHVRVHLAADPLPAAQRLARPDELFIGKPVLGKVSKRWTIQLSRRIAAPDGRLLGVVVASLDPGYFEDVYRGVQLGQAGGVTLLGRDLAVRARVVGGKSINMGDSLPAGAGFVRETQGKAEGSYQTASGLDGVERIVAFRQIAGYPLYLTVATSLGEALGDWRSMRDIALTLCGALSLALVAGIAVFIRQLDQLTRTHVALQRSEAQAQSASQAKSEFIAAISHELRTPLTSIRGFAELMEERLEDARARKQAGLIRKGAEHLNTLLTQILDLAKVEAGAVQLTQEPVDLLALIQGTADFFALTAASKLLVLHVEIGDGVPRTVVCDGLRLKQILNNLLSNALKFTERGSVTLRVRQEDQQLAFDVADTGPGIPLDKQQLIFEKFRQADDRVSFQHGGTGLGLALSRGLAELMHGRLELVSQPGEGACFTLTLPQPLAPAPRAGAEALPA